MVDGGAGRPRGKKVVNPPSDYEWGQSVQSLKQLDHNLRNLKATVALQDSENESLRADLAKLTTELQRVKVEIRTALSVLGFVGSVFAYLFR